MTNRKPKDQNTPWAKRKMKNIRELKNFEIRNLFRIYCEGVNTEPEYFKSFPVTTETKIEAIGLGRSKTSLVEKTIEILSNEELLKGQNNFDEDRQLWVVFDYDVRREENEAQDFNNAIELAKRNGIRVAYSNDSFELWFVLHYKYLTSSLTRNEYYEMLSIKLNCKYEEEGKSKEFAKSLYGIFLPHQSAAIKNAKRLLEEKSETLYSNQNPCTTVFELVEELNKCLRR